MRRLKVTFVIQKLASVKGGAERVLCEVSSAIASRGHDVEVLTFERRSGSPGYPLTGVKTKNLFPFQKEAEQRSQARSPYRLENLAKSVPNVPPLSHIKFALTYGFFANRVARHLRRNRPDVVIGFLPAGIIAASRSAGKLRIPSVASIHSVPDQDFGDGERWDPNPIYRSARIQALRSVDCILTLQSGFVEGLHEDLRRKARVMPNPVMQGNLQPIPAHSREKLIIAVGRLVKSKRYDLLVSSWAKLAKRFPDWRVEVYGDGPEHGRLLDLIAEHNLPDRMSLKGTTDDIGEVYRRASILFHPSEFEGFGLSVAEALSHGVPVIADAACSGVNALVLDGVSGFLVGPDPADATWTKALEKLMTHADQRNKFGVAGQQSMAAFDIVRVTDMWVNMLHELADRTGDEVCT